MKKNLFLVALFIFCLGYNDKAYSSDAIGQLVVGGALTAVGGGVAHQLSKNVTSLRKHGSGFAVGLFVFGALYNSFPDNFENISGSAAIVFLLDAGFTAVFGAKFVNEVVKRCLASGDKAQTTLEKIKQEKENS
jgi:hypothetical protein